MWLQHLRIIWLKEGERNTTYSHRIVVSRAHRNLIQRLSKVDGSWCHTPTYMEGMATSYFRGVHKDPPLVPDVVLDCIHPKVTAAMNESLSQSYSEKEISNMLFQIGPLKAPGNDGFPAQFYQRN